MRIPNGRLKGLILPPPSKSMTHRALILAASSQKGSKIFNLLESEDTQATKNILENMGAAFKKIDRGLEVIKTLSKAPTNGNCLNSGTTLRLLVGIASLFGEESKFYGDPSLNSRPMIPLIHALEQLGAKISSNDGTPPIIIKQGIQKNLINCNIRGDVSSQFISSLLILSALRSEGISSRINLIKPIISKPYIKLTIQMLERLGVEINKNETNYKIMAVNRFNQFELQVVSDYSSAAFFIVAGSLPGNEITINSLSNGYSQADAQILDFVESAGAKVTRENDNITIRGSSLHAFKANIQDCPDLFPILCVLATEAKGESVIYGAKHLKHKETNRISGMEINLKEAGIDFKATNDGAIIKGGKIKKIVEFDSFGDHRIAMACAILSTRVKNGSKLLNHECAKVSYPSFYSELKRLMRLS